MKLAVCVLFSVLVLFALYSEIEAVPADGNNGNCQGTRDRRCPLRMCGPDGIKSWRNQDNTKPYPGCCGGPICF